MRPPLRQDLESLTAYMAPQVDAPVRLNTNECAYPLPEGFAEDLAGAVRRIPFHRYPDREASGLRAGLAEMTGHQVEGIWAANGSNEVLQHLCLAYGGPGRTVLLFDPTYSMHALIPRMVGMDLVREPLPPGFVLDHASATDAVARRAPDVVFLCSPNNPTGNAQPAETVDALCRAAPLVVADEAYVEFGGTSVQPLLDRHPNLVVVRTFSKAFSLAAVRLGYCLASEEIVDDLRKVRLPYHLSSLTQEAGRVALRHLPEARTVLAAIVDQRDRILDGLAAMPGVEAFPSAANFVLFRTAAHAPTVWKDLLARGVLIRDVSSGPGLEGCLRVTAGTPEETSAFLDALREAREGSR